MFANWYLTAGGKKSHLPKQYGQNVRVAGPEQIETSLEEVLAVLQALNASGCRYWLEGGWGVDALAGRQTRTHRDVDIDFDAACKAPRCRS